MDAFFMSYRDRVKDIISGKIQITGAPVEEFDKNTGKGIDADAY
jgi:hypothetical protein